MGSGLGNNTCRAEAHRKAEEDFEFDLVAMEVSANPLWSPEAELALQSCSKQGPWSFFIDL